MNECFLPLLVIHCCFSLVSSDTDGKVDLTRDFFIKIGVTSEKADEPDSALRSFRTALRLLDEEGLEINEYLQLRNFIHSWMQITKTRRLGAFKPISAVIKFDQENSDRIQWTMGDDLQQLSYEKCEQYVPESVHEECLHSVFKQLVEAEEQYRPPARNGIRPPRYIPEELWDNYTRNYAVVVNMYRDDSQPGYYQEWTKRELDEFAGIVQRRQDGTNYPEVDRLLYKLFDGKPGPIHRAMLNQSVAIMGSAAPWYEVLVLQFGARETVTIEYNRLHFSHPRMRTLTPGEFWSTPAGGSAPPQPRERFALALSISSFEHDGLGRYGDPLLPDGDMAAMRQMETILLPGGVLVLAVPVAADSIVWNCHRVYGPRRLTSLLERWTVLEVRGLTDAMFDSVVKFPSQPVFVLENTRPARPVDFARGDWTRLVPKE